MRRRNRLGSRFFIGVAVVIVLCILSALYSGVTGNPSPVTTAVGIVATPIQKLATGVSGFFGKGLSYFTEFDALKAENEELHRQIREMEQTVRDAQLAIEENNRLRAQAGQPERARELTTLNAEVIARNPGDWATVLTLDKAAAPSAPAARRFPSIRRIGIGDVFPDLLHTGRAGCVAERPVMRELLRGSQAVLQQEAGFAQRFDL